jgi:hypothetical protein
MTYSAILSPDFDLAAFEGTEFMFDFPEFSPAPVPHITWHGHSSLVRVYHHSLTGKYGLDGNAYTNLK